MPQMKDILREGPEYIRRSFRCTVLRARLSDQQNALRRVLRGLGKIAWEMGVPSCKSAPTQEKIRQLDSAEAESRSREEENAQRLRAEIECAEEELKAARAAVGDLAQRLRGTDRQAQSRRQAISQCERRIEKIKAEMERLKLDLVRCRESIGKAGSDDAEDGLSPPELAGVEETLQSRIEELTTEEKTLTVRLEENREALPPLEETLEALTAEQEEKAAVVAAVADRLDALRMENREAAKAARFAAKDLGGQRLELYARLGEELMSRRSDEPELQPFFTSADLLISTVENLRHDIDAETKLLDLLDPNAVAAFVGVALGVGLLAAALISLVISLLIVS